MADRGTDGERPGRGKSTGRKFLSRVKTALSMRRSEPSKRQATLPTSITTVPPPTLLSADAAPTSSTPFVASSGPPLTTPVLSHTQQQHQIEPVTQPDGSLSVIEGEKIPRSQIYGERAQRLSERFGLQVDASNLYSTDGHVLRVHKPIRMRVHRECHLCGGSVNTTGLCDKCQHTFCHQCTRYPPKRSECERLASRAHRTELQRQHDASAIIAPDLNMDNNHQPMAVLRMPPRPATQRQLVHKKIRQRVRRTCCKCQEAGEGDVLFVYAERECSKCRHARCTDCPRDPAKKDKYPYGYPGDEFGDKSVPHYRCHTCENVFPPGIENGTVCATCSHEKCDLCERLRPQKVEPKPDPEVVRAVRERLAAVTVPPSVGPVLGELQERGERLVQPGP